MQSEAQKQARNRWKEKNPSSTVRLPEDRYNALRQAANDMNIGYHGLLSKILLDWLEKENR